MGNSYEDDVIAWAYEQAAHLREHRWAALAQQETGLFEFPDEPGWSTDSMLEESHLPD